MQSEAESSRNVQPAGAFETSRKGHSRRDSSLCTACDQCYRCKVRCSGERPTCERCITNSSACTYSTGKPLGKPKGSKNRLPRRKTTSQLPHAMTITDSSMISPRPAKRSSDEALPPAKRPMSADASSGYMASTLASTFSSPSKNIPDLPSLNTVQGRQSTIPVNESLIYPDHDLAGDLNHNIVPKMLDEAFPSAGLDLEVDDFKWFTVPQNEQFIALTPTAGGLEIATNPSSVCGDGASFTSVQALHMELPQAQLHTSPISPPDQYAIVQHKQHKQCLCDPLSLSIISELHSLQLNLSPLDTALIAARRGLSTVSSYLTCPSCAHHLSTSPSLFLACVLILQQVFACYVTLRMQGSSMLTNNKRADSPQAGSSICIGDFEVQGEESCNVLLDAIVRSEIERGKGVIGTLEQWAEKVGDGKERVAGVLLQSLRDDIVAVY